MENHRGASWFRVYKILHGLTGCCGHKNAAARMHIKKNGVWILQNLRKYVMMDL